MTRNIGTLHTLTAQSVGGLGYVSSADQTGYNVTRVSCVINRTAATSSPSAVLVYQNKDAASGLYYNVVSSGAVTSSNVPTPLFFGAGVTSGANVGNPFPVAATWRTQVWFSGTGTFTGTVGCTVQ